MALVEDAGSATVFSLARSMSVPDHIAHKPQAGQCGAPREASIARARVWKMMQEQDRGRVVDASTRRRNKQDRELGGRQESEEAFCFNS
jgi:hypothetical protein